MTVQVAKGRHIYLLRGDEPRIVADAEAELIADLRSGSEVDVAIFDAEVVAGAEVCAALEQMHIFADAAAVCVRGVDKLSEDAVAVIVAYLSAPGRSQQMANYLVMSSFSGKISPKVAKVAAELGVVLDLKLSNDALRTEFFSEALATSPLHFSSEALARMIEHLGEDVARIRSLLEVLEARFEPAHRISAADVEPYLVRAGSLPLYQLTNAIENCRRNGEAEVLLQLRRFTEELRIHPLVLVAVISRRMIEIASVSSPSITTADAVNARLEANGAKKKVPFAAKKLLEAARMLDYPSVVRALSWCAEAEGRIKGLDGVPEDFALELLVARLCNLFARKRKGSSIASS